MIWDGKGLPRGSEAARPDAHSRTAPAQQLYDLAKQRDIPGRSKMGKWELIDALRR
jgi:hypothetical protein